MRFITCRPHQIGYLLTLAKVGSSKVLVQAKFDLHLISNSLNTWVVFKCILRFFFFFFSFLLALVCLLGAHYQIAAVAHLDQN